MKNYLQNQNHQPEKPFGRLFKLNGVKWRVFCFFLLLQLSSAIVYAQTPVNITGVVTDDKGSAMPGVTVKLKNTTIAAVSDITGKYKISVPDGQGILTFSFIGFNPVEIDLKGRTTVDVQLKETPSSLNEVVVIGYGTQKKSDLTGSVSVIGEKAISNYATDNVSQLLQGQAAGVYVASNSGQPGDAAVVRIRGFGTVNNNDPLYVVDGQYLDDINNLNNNDIASITILKDASATAIYGSRGSNGVIVITTKKANKGDNTVVTADGYVGVRTTYKSPGLTNSDQYFAEQEEASKNYNSPTSALESAKFIQQYLKGYSTDWYSEMNQNALNQTYNVSIRNGGEKSQSYLSFGYQDQQGALITTDFKKGTIKYNTEYDAGKNVILGINVTQIYYHQNFLGGLPSFAYIADSDPFAPVLNPNITPDNDPNYQYDKWAPAETSYQTNPVSLIENKDSEVDNENTLGNVYATIKLFNGFSFHTQQNVNLQLFRFNEFTPTFVNTADIYNTARATTRSNTATNERAQRNQNINFLSLEQFNYDKSFGKHTVSALFGYQEEINSANNISANKAGAPGNDPSNRVIDAGTTGIANGGSASSTLKKSFIARINYNYNDRYLLTGTYRADGSSIFAFGHQWGYFPSLAAAWRLSEEPFFKALNLGSKISSIKFRGGWGQVGNDKIASNAAITKISSSANDQYSLGSAGYSPAYLPTTQGNPDIKWEITQSTNVGMDAEFFNSALSITADYYNKKTIGMLLQVPLPPSSGYLSLPYSNAGTMQNRGTEFAINYQTQIGKVNLSFGVNAAFNKNKVLSLGNGDLPILGTISKTIVGEPIGRFFALQQLGVFQNQAEIAAYLGPAGKEIQPNAKPGDFKFQDTNGDGIISAADNVFVGDPNPKMVYGFNLNFAYKSFNLRANFQGTLGNQIYDTLKGFGAASAGGADGLLVAYTDAWRKEGDSGAWPELTYASANNNYGSSSWYVEDGSYLRLENLQLGYQIPSSFLQRTGFIRSCNLFVSGQNVLTFTKYKGLDPEIGSGNVLNIGYDPVRYPTSRTISVGLNARF